MAQKDKTGLGLNACDGFGRGLVWGLCFRYIQEKIYLKRVLSVFVTRVSLRAVQCVVTRPPPPFSNQKCSTAGSMWF